MVKAAALYLSTVLGFCVLMLASGVQKRPPAPFRLPGQVQASPEQHKAVTRRVFDDLFNRGRYESISEIYSRDCVVHHNNKITSLDQAVSEGKGWRSAAPDLQMTPDAMTVQGDIVTVSWTAKGTHTGKGNGLVRPTGKRFLMHGASRFRIVDGKIAEVWNDYDRNELFRQLGVPPTMAFLYEQTEDVRLAFNQIFSRPLADII